MLTFSPKAFCKRFNENPYGHRAKSAAQQNLWTERGRTASVSNPNTTGRPRRSVLPLLTPPSISSGKLTALSSPPDTSAHPGKQGRRRRGLHGWACSPGYLQLNRQGRVAETARATSQKRQKRARCANRTARPASAPYLGSRVSEGGVSRGALSVESR